MAVTFTQAFLDPKAEVRGEHLESGTPLLTIGDVRLLLLHLTDAERAALLRRIAREATRLAVEADARCREAAAHDTENMLAGAYGR